MGISSTLTDKLEVNEYTCAVLQETSPIALCYWETQVLAWDTYLHTEVSTSVPVRGLSGI